MSLETLTAQLDRLERELRAQEVVQSEPLRTALRNAADLRPQMSPALMKTTHRITLAMLTRLEERREDSNALLELLTEVLDLLPSESLDSLTSTAKPQTTESGWVTELDPDDAFEPLGGKVLLVAALFAEKPAAHRLLCRLPGGENPAERLLYFVEDVRSVLLPRWKSFHQHQSDNAAFSSSPPSFEQRFVEGNRLKGLFYLLFDEPLPDRVLDRWISCVLFCLDDFDPRVAVLGGESLDRMLRGASEEGWQRWEDVLHRTIMDRLLSCQIDLWTVLVPVACLFCERIPRHGIGFIEKMLERLETDMSPYELGSVFLDHASKIVHGVGTSVVRCFSKLFPLLTRWLLSSDRSLQRKGLAFLMDVMRVASERIPRHQAILLEILSAVERQYEGKDDEVLRSSIGAARQQLQETVQMKNNEAK